MRQITPLPTFDALLQGNNADLIINDIKRKVNELIDEHNVLIAAISSNPNLAVAYREAHKKYYGKAPE